MGVGPVTNLAIHTAHSEKNQLRFAPLGGDRLTLQWGDAEYNMSGWAVADSSSLMVCVGNEQRTSAPSDCLADASLWAAAPLRLLKSLWSMARSILMTIGLICL